MQDAWQGILFNFHHLASLLLFPPPSPFYPNPSFLPPLSIAIPPSSIYIHLTVSDLKSAPRWLVKDLFTARSALAIQPGSVHAEETMKRLEDRIVHATSLSSSPTPRMSGRMSPAQSAELNQLRAQNKQQAQLIERLKAELTKTARIFSLLIYLFISFLPLLCHPLCIPPSLFLLPPSQPLFLSPLPPPLLPPSQFFFDPSRNWTSRSTKRGRHQSNDRPTRREGRRYQ